MVRIATIKKIKDEKSSAVDHIKNTVLFPSALLGLISIVLGYGSLIYLMFKGRNFAGVMIDSLVLLGVGLLLGLVQFLYHRFLFDRFPDYYVALRRRGEQIRSRKIKKIETVIKPEHAGRFMVPFFYIAGLAVLVGTIVFYYQRLNPLSAVFLPLAGFYNLRFFFWKKKLKL